MGMLEKLTQELNLTPDQVAKIGPIIDTARAKTKAIRQDTTLTADQQKAQIEPIHKQEMVDIKALLTPAQLATLKSVKKVGAPVGATPPSTAPTTTTTPTTPTN
jgi:protein CpxP